MNRLYLIIIGGLCIYFGFCFVFAISWGVFQTLKHIFSNYAIFACPLIVIGIICCKYERELDNYINKTFKDKKNERTRN
jgi:hypothetical protein